MVNQEQIVRYIQHIPPAPHIVKQTLDYVRSGDLTKAAKCAEEDPALKFYLKTLVNRPIYGFRNEVSDLAQIFTILGISTAQQILYNYLLTLMAPKEWALFNLTSKEFYDLQASLSRKWVAILTHLNLLSHDTESAITLLPASIIVCDALFGEYKNEVEQLRSVKALDYNTILFRMTKMSLFDICNEIARKWELPPLIGRIVHASSGIGKEKDETLVTLAKWMHLLLFYELSQSVYVEAGLNEFIEFHIDFVQDIYESFMNVVGYDESNC